MTFSILFWNIWYRNQVGGDAKREHLLHELKRLTDQHKPDFIALNEVVKSSQDKTAPVVEYLRKLGYDYDHCANMAQFDNYWMSGVTLSSRFPLSQKQNMVISENAYAANHGYPGMNKEAISAQVAFPGIHDLKIIVAHPVAIADSLKEHQVGMRNLSRVIRSKAYAKNTILVGDMNEWRLIPGSFRHRVSGIMQSQTGSTLHPTWRHNAHRFTPLRLNLDYVYWNRESDFYLKDFKVLSSGVSDHRPLLATFGYK